MLDHHCLELAIRSCVRQWRLGAAGLAFALWLANTGASAQDRAAEPPQISVVTFGRGDAVHQYFGHDAFVVGDPASPRATVFNYGMFSFGPDMIPSFLRGRLRFWVGTTELRQTAAMYAASGRDVRIRELNLEPATRGAILRQLEHDALPEHRYYLYDHYFDNCATRIRDALDRALGGQLHHAWSRGARFSLREETRRHTQHDPVVEWLMMLGLNASVDRPQSLWGDAFLPEQLEHLLETTSYRDSRQRLVPLVAAKRDLFLAQRPALPQAPARRWPFTLAIGFGLGLAPLVLVRRARTRTHGVSRHLLAALATGYGVVAGLLGTLLMYLACFSDHLVTHHNQNLLLVNPLLLVAGLLGPAIMRSGLRAERVLRWLWACIASSTLALLAYHVLGVGLRQDISLSATLLAPANLGFALASWSRELVGARAGRFAVSAAD